MVEISIIVPVYNVAQYLPKCINSIIEQTYSAWELILVDDGSKDESGLLCDIFAEKDKRIKVFHIENSGVSKARNVGLQNASGRYIAFVDGDDWIENDMYEKLVNEMNQGVDIVFCRFYRDYTNKSLNCFEKNLANLEKKPYDFGQIIYENELNVSNKQITSDNVFGSVCRSLFKRNLIEIHQINFSTDVFIAEDKLFLMEYLLHCQNASVLDFYGYHYRAERKNSAINSHTVGYQKNISERRKQLIEIESLLIQKNNRLTKKEKVNLITYEKYRLCFDSVINEVLFNKDYLAQLNDIFRDSFFKNAITLQSFVHMHTNGTTLKRRLLYILIYFRCWRVIKYMLTRRHGGE